MTPRDVSRRRRGLLPLHVWLPRELLERLDLAVGRRGRAAWVRRMIAAIEGRREE